MLLLCRLSQAFRLGELLGEIVWVERHWILGLRLDREASGIGAVGVHDVRGCPKLQTVGTGTRLKMGAITPVWLFEAREGRCSRARGARTGEARAALFSAMAESRDDRWFLAQIEKAIQQ